MPHASSEATLGLIETLRTKFSGVVRVCGVPEPIRDDGEGPPIYVVHLDSPLIDPDAGVVEIVIEGGSLRFKPWADV